MHLIRLYGDSVGSKFFRILTAITAALAKFVNLISVNGTHTHALLFVIKLLHLWLSVAVIVSGDAVASSLSYRNTG
jgi:hypothetical protein